MDKKYITLFRDLAQATASSAESVMDYDREKDDQQGLNTATVLRNDYQELVDKFTDNYQMIHSDAAKLLVAAMIQTNQIKDRIKMLQKALLGYQTELIPKLQDIVEQTKTDEEAIQMAEEKFITQE